MLLYWLSFILSAAKNGNFVKCQDQASFLLGTTGPSSLSPRYNIVGRLGPHSLKIYTGHPPHLTCHRTSILLFPMSMNVESLRSQGSMIKSTQPRGVVQGGMLCRSI